MKTDVEFEQFNNDEIIGACEKRLRQGKRKEMRI